MEKKKQKEVKPKQQPNPNHKEDFLNVLSAASQPKKQVKGA